MLDPREILPAAQARAAARQPADLDLPDLRRRARRYERRRRTLTTGAVLLPLLAVVFLLVAPVRDASAPTAEPLDLAEQPESAAVPPALPRAEPFPVPAEPQAQVTAPAAPPPLPPPSPTLPAASPGPTVAIAPDAPASVDPGPHRLWLEAEDGALTPPMLTYSGGDADSSSNGAHVLTEDGVIQPGDPPGSGAVDLDVVVPQAATYVIWALVRAPDHAANSFFVSMDGGEATYWWLPPSPEWQWVPVSDRGTTDQPKHYALSAGTHRLRIATREDGVALDQILVTSVVDDLPDALGPAP